MESRIWIFFVALAGLCWGAYVPFVAAGGKELKSSYASLICVGAAYFLIAILFLVPFLSNRGERAPSRRPVAVLSVIVIYTALGVLTYATAESGRRYTEVDLDLATDLSNRAAVAIENTQLYQALREADRRNDRFLATLADERQGRHTSAMPCSVRANTKPATDSDSATEPAADSRSGTSAVLINLSPPE